MLGINLMIPDVGRGKWEDTQGRLYEKIRIDLCTQLCEMNSPKEKGSDVRI